MNQEQKIELITEYHLHLTELHKQYCQDDDSDLDWPGWLAEVLPKVEGFWDEFDKAIEKMIEERCAEAELLGRTKEAVNLRHRWVLPDVIMGKFDDRIRELQAKQSSSEEASNA